MRPCVWRACGRRVSATHAHTIDASPTNSNGKRGVTQCKGSGGMQQHVESSGAKGCPSYQHIARLQQGTWYQEESK